MKTYLINYFSSQSGWPIARYLRSITPKSFAIVLATMVSIGAYAQQIEVTPTDATCRQNGVLTWTEADGAIVSYNVSGTELDGGTFMTSLAGVSLMGLEPGSYTVTPVVDGVEGMPVTGTIADAFGPLDVELSTSYTCGYQIDVNVLSGDLASIQILSGPGSPMVNGIVSITDVEFPETYELLFTDACGETTQIDYTIEFLFPTRLGVGSTSCNIGASCNSIEYSVAPVGERAAERPVSFEYLVNGSVVASGQNNGTTFTGSIPYACEDEIVFDIRATLNCGTVFTREVILDNEVLVIDKPENCNDCIYLSVPFSTGGMTTITYTTAPTAMNLEGTSFTQMGTACEVGTNRDDYVDYELCTDGPFEEGLYTVAIDNGCCPRSVTFNYVMPQTSIGGNSRYTCTDGEGVLFVTTSGSFVDAEVTDLNGNIVGSLACPRGDDRGFFTTELPYGTYNVEITDACGDMFTEQLTLQERSWELGADITLGCGSFNVEIRDDGQFAPVGVSSAAANFSYFLEWESSPGVWDTLASRGNIPWGGVISLDNITELGNFRLRRTQVTGSCLTCDELIFFTQNNNELDFTTLEGVQCSVGGLYTINASALGEPLAGNDITYEVRDSGDNLVASGGAESGQNYTANNLPEGTYTVVASNECGSQIREIELVDLPPLMIMGEASYCAGSDATLSIGGFSFLDFVWTDPAGNVVSTISTLDISNVSAANAGTYTVMVTSAGNACINSTLTFELNVEAERILEVVSDNNLDCDAESCYTFTYTSPDADDDIVINWDIRSNNSGFPFPTSITLTAEDVVSTSNGITTYTKQLCQTFSVPPGTPGATNQAVSIENFVMTTPSGCDVSVPDRFRNLSKGVAPISNIEVFSDSNEVTCGGTATFTIESRSGVNSMITYEINGISVTEPFGIASQDPDGDGLYVLTVTVPNVNAPTTLELVGQTYSSGFCDRLFDGGNLQVETVNVTMPPMPPAVNCWDDFQYDFATCTYVNVGDPNTPVGCTNPNSANYDPAAVCDDGSCIACPQPNAAEISMVVGTTTLLCSGDDAEVCFVVNGTNSEDFEVTIIYTIDGVESTTLIDYDGSISTSAKSTITLSNITLATTVSLVGAYIGTPACDIDDSVLQSTEVIDVDPNAVLGCTDPTALNYNPAATCDDGSCDADPCEGINPITPSLSVSSNTLCEGQMLEICVTGEPNAEYGVTEDGDISPFFGAVFRTDANGLACQTITTLGAGSGTFNLVSFREGSCTIRYEDLDISELVTVSLAPDQPQAVNCWDDYVLDNSTCTWTNQGVDPVFSLLPSFFRTTDCDNAQACFTLRSPIAPADFGTFTLQYTVDDVASSVTLNASSATGSPIGGLQNYQVCDTNLYAFAAASSYTLDAGSVTLTDVAGCVQSIDNASRTATQFQALREVMLVVDVTEVECGGDASICFTTTGSNSDDFTSNFEYTINGQAFSGTIDGDDDQVDNRLRKVTIPLSGLTSNTVIELVSSADPGQCPRVYNGVVETITVGDCGNTGCTVFNFEDFENGYGIWNDGGTDCYLNYEPAQGGNGSNYCVRTRDNSGWNSSLYTSPQDFSCASEIRVDFMYLPESMESGEDFFLEYSTDGGATFATAAQWVSGVHFQNGNFYNETTSITGTFTSSTVLRFRCDASNNSDRVYLDNISISLCGCDSGNPASCNGAISSFELINPGGHVINAITDGYTYCGSDYSTSWTRVRVGATGDHQSVLITVTGPAGTVSKTENMETYDSDWIWAAYAGTYTVTAKLYSEDNLGGMACDERTISFTVVDCNQPTFDCPSLSLNIGDACDDGDALTENDVVNSNCQCAGTPVVDNCTRKILTISNDGICAVNVYRWIATGDVYYATMDAGQQWSVQTSPSHVWRVVDTHNDWNNLKHDESYTVGEDCEQIWSVNPTYCDQTGGGNTGDCSSTLVHYQGFESGWGQWIDGGTDCTRYYDPNIDIAGNYCVRLRDNTHNNSSAIIGNLNFDGVQQVTVDFIYIAKSMEHGEDFMLEYSNDGGLTYTTVQSWRSGTDFYNGETKKVTVAFSGSFSSTTKIRFRCDATSNYDIIYLDEIYVYACGGSWLSDGGNIAYASTQSESLKMDLQDESFATPASDLQVDGVEALGSKSPVVEVYPIPSTDIVNVKGLDGQTYDVYSIAGQRIIKDSNDQVLDISGFQDGTYLLRASDGQIVRFVKM